MSFNYGNLPQQLQNMLPFFNNINNNGPGANLMQLAAAMNSSAGGISSAQSSNSSNSTKIFNANPSSVPSSSSSSTMIVRTSRRTPEPPPAPRLSSPSPTRKNNQGMAPMDLDNDMELENYSSNVNNSAASSKNRSQINMTDQNLYLMTAGQLAMNPFMFYPNSAGQTLTSANVNAANSLLDPAALMAAAMQQIQQTGFQQQYNANAGTMPELGAADSGKVSTHQQLTLQRQTSTETPSTQSLKEVVKTKHCMLLPPNPNAPPPTVRDRPPGCRTVFVGGLPESISEDVLREVFESCGDIATLRMSKKNFCHIRFRQEESVDLAIYLSGYRIRVNNSATDATSLQQQGTNFGRLHVDYAHARDDQYEYECKQRQLQREQRHRERVSHDRSRSPPPIPHYTDHEASTVSENLRNNETFLKAIQTIIIWLERGDCTKRNANVFYSMIQSTHAHVRRLTSEKQGLDDDLHKAKEIYRKQMLAMSAQITQIDKMFNAASHKNQKVWDHFTKAQRKNIDQWKKMATDLRNVQIDDDEMEMSDDDRDYAKHQPAKRRRYDIEGLKEENDSLRCQLEAIRHEMTSERSDLKFNSDFREKQMKVLQETIRNMQTQIMQTKMREQKDAKTIEQMSKKLREAGVKQLLLKTKIREASEKIKVHENNSSNQSIASDIATDCAAGIVELSGNANSSLEKQTKTIDDEEEITTIIDIDVDRNDDDDDDVVEIIEDDDKSNHYKDNARSKDKEEITEKIETDVTKSQKNIQVEVEAKLKSNQEFAKKQEELQSEGEQNRHDSEKQSDENEANVEDSKLRKNNVNTILLNSKESHCITLDEAKIISLSTAFLLVHPLGTSCNSICSYIQNLNENKLELNEKQLNSILAKYENIFKSDAPPITVKEDLQSKVTEANTDDDDDFKFVKHADIKWKYCGLLQ